MRLMQLDGDFAEGVELLRQNAGVVRVGSRGFTPDPDQGPFTPWIPS